MLKMSKERMLSIVALTVMAILVFAAIKLRLVVNV